MHRAYDEATAILAGDALLTLAFDVVADEATSDNAALRARLVVELARASGLGGMVGGHMLDLAAEAAPKALPRDEIERLQAMKTGALLHFAVRAGGLMAGCEAESLAHLDEFGHKLGAAFQIADDLLDYYGDAGLMGKKVGKDADRNKATLVSVLGVVAAQSLAEKLTLEAKASLARLSCSGDKAVLSAAVEFIVSRES